MQQFIYHSGSKEDRAEAIEREFPRADHLVTRLVAEESSLKIKDIRDITSSLTITHQGSRLIWIEEAHSLTLPAQHALLKTLEEPPISTIIILSTNSPSSLLPTIVSRCRLVSVTASEGDKLSLDELSLIKSALTSSPGTRLQLAATLGKKREEVKEYLTTVIITLHQVMQETKNQKSLSLLSNISDKAHLALTRVVGNTNVTLAIESFFLTLPRSH